MQHDFEPDPDVCPQWKMIFASWYTLGSPPPDIDGVASVADEFIVISSTFPFRKQNP